MNGNATMNGNEIFAKAIREEFHTAFPNMRYVDMEAAFGGYPVAAIGFDDDAFTLKLALSGFSREDVRVAVVDGEIEVTNNESQKTLFGQGVKTAFSKMKMSKFRRRYPMPQGTNPSEVRWTMHDGVLSITVPTTRRGIGFAVIDAAPEKETTE